MQLEFDLAKEAANLAKHGVDFSTVLRVFEDPDSSMINHNRKGEAFEIEQPKVGPKGESRPWGRSRKTADRQLRRRSGLGEPANQPSGSERVKGHRE